MTKRLTWEQKSIVSHDTGHALVKAVPGSGKTTILVKRVERLVKTGTDPRSILILMYNKSAQVSFTEREQEATLMSGMFRNPHVPQLGLKDCWLRRTPTDNQEERPHYSKRLPL